jgi:hypothetical protein
LISLLRIIISISVVSSSSTVSNDNSLMSVMSWLMHINNIDMSTSMSVGFNYGDMWLLIVGLNNYDVWLNDGVMLLNNHNMRLRLDIDRLAKASSNDNFLLNMDVHMVL